MDHVIAETCFWGCVGGVAYAYAGYPALLYAAGRVFGWREEPPKQTERPFVSVLICAHNEEAVIARRVANALAADYPEERMEVVIASDGSDDRTVEIARASGARVLAYPQRRGKAATLNSAMREARGEIVVLSDANTEIEPEAVGRLARWFADERVGVVCGRLLLDDAPGGANADGAYWRYETFLKRWEGRLGALLGANGAIYAVRKELTPQLPAGTIVDDFVLPLLVRLRSGHRIVYDESAIALEETAANQRDEFQRRARIGAGAMEALAALWPLMDPRNGWIAWSFVSHKVLRWAGPLMMIGALAASAVLWREPIYRMFFCGQIVFYAGGMAAGRCSRRLWRPVRLAAMFTDMNVALLAGFVRWGRGKQGAAWAPTARRGTKQVELRQAA